MTDFTDIQRRMHDLNIDYARREPKDPTQWAARYEAVATEARTAGMPEAIVSDFELYERKNFFVS
ncbi:hypothetical protein [Brevundimonas sp.]|uniref:hypothetical protein n=1 Tax=Brevundimonas sp. TaxID=1871086 RepID=UPI0028965F07|nr:hypothetical protein [Brevundimonas sp.]